ARAQLAASESEALGLLRMLNCGSDALPYAEGADGAYAKLMRHGLGEREAYDALVLLASLDRATADRYLTSLHLDAAARDDVLAATHCQPPASYLVLNSQQATFDGWWQLGLWAPDRDGPAADRRQLVTPDWVPCVPSSGGQRRCTIGAIDARGVRIDAVVYADGDARSARV